MPTSGMPSALGDIYCILCRCCKYAYRHENTGEGLFAWWNDGVITLSRSKGRLCWLCSL